MSKNLSVRFCATTRALLLLPKGPVRRYRVRGGSKRQPFSVLLCRHTPQTSGDNRPSSVADRAYRLFTRFPIRGVLGNSVAKEAAKQVAVPYCAQLVPFTLYP